MKIKTANWITLGFGFTAVVSFFTASGCYYTILCKVEYSGNQGPYIHIIGLGFILLFVAALPRFATVVFNLAERRIISDGSSKRLDNWLVIDELRRGG